jgi:hypothetical protein
MGAISTFIIVLSVVLLVLEFSSAAVYGRLIGDSVILKYLDEFKPFSVNQFNDVIISPAFDSTKTIEEIKHRVRNGKFISKTPLSITSKYYISTIGRVPRWSKTNDLIEELYKTSYKTSL